MVQIKAPEQEKDLEKNDKDEETNVWMARGSTINSESDLKMKAKNQCKEWYRSFLLLAILILANCVLLVNVNIYDITKMKKNDDEIHFASTNDTEILKHNEITNNNHENGKEVFNDNNKISNNLKEGKEDYNHAKDFDINVEEKGNILKIVASSKNVLI